MNILKIAARVAAETQIGRVRTYQRVEVASMKDLDSMLPEERNAWEAAHYMSDGSVFICQGCGLTSDHCECETPVKPDVDERKFFKLDSVEWDSEDQEDISFPTFRVKGAVNGKPFESKISLSLEDQEVDMEYISGYDLHDAWSDIPGYDAAELYILINESPAYVEAVDHYGLGIQQGS